MKISNLPAPIVPDLRTARPDSQPPRGTDRSAPDGARAGAVRAETPRPVAWQPPNASARTSTLGAGSRGDPAAPEGTDPKLWSILTSEERSFFSRNSAQGPLTYARVMLGAQAPTLSAPAMRGLSLDIRG